MAFQNLKSDGIKYLLGKLKTVFLQIKDAVKSVNGELPDENGNIEIDEVPYAGNLTSDSTQTSRGTFIQRSSGGTASIDSGDAWLMSLRGNYTHEGYSPEVLTPVVNSTAENPIEISLNRNTFVAYVEESGTITLTYSSSAWSANPILYGITVTGTPTEGDQIVITYVKEERGTITQSNPQAFRSTGWNLFNYTNGYARVVKYSESRGFRVEGTYTAIKFSETLEGTQTDITVTDGNFTIPSDGFVWITGGNSSDTAIYMTWDDWTEEANGGTFVAYEEDEIDLSTLMASKFPYGLMAVGTVADEINLNLGTATSRVDRMEYSTANLATAKASGREYEYDEDYIYIAKAEADVYSVTLDGSYAADDHGMEIFDGTDVPVTVLILYGNNLKNKLERDVVQVSSQTLSDSQKTQVRTNIGAASSADITTLSGQISANATAIATKTTVRSLKTLKTTATASTTIKVKDTVASSTVRGLLIGASSSQAREFLYIVTFQSGGNNNYATEIMKGSSITISASTSGITVTTSASSPTGVFFICFAGDADDLTTT